MKVKEISRTANVAWSPGTQLGIYLACGTAAQQLDATFSTTAKLEVFCLDLAQPGLSLPLVASINSPLRFHKLAWSDHGAEGSTVSGVIAGGSDNGTLTLWAADRIVSGLDNPQVHQNSQHSGPVRTIDFNPFQANLLASGASESEIFIWDLNNPGNAMSPGNKSHPLEDITGVAWNRQVQHILASTSPSGRSIVWDLRKNEPIIQVADPNSRVQCNSIAWHPEVATQMVTGSGDDRSPIIQLWDLRFATSPVRTLDRHKKGVLSLAWCPQDPDLLLSAAKDNHVLCWNPNSDMAGGEVVYELPANTQWIFECHWCPRNPAIISTSSFDGHVTMYSLLGGGTHVQEATDIKTPPPSNDPFASIAMNPRQQPVETAPLKRPPKWLRRPCGAKFAFGGKLVSFSDSKSSPDRTVLISQVVTEQSLLDRSSVLEDVLSQKNYGHFCQSKADSSSSPTEQSIWNFLKVTFEPEPRRQYLNLLGYSTEKLEKQLSSWVTGSLSSAASTLSVDPDDLSQRLSSLPLGVKGEDEAAANVFDSPSQSVPKPQSSPLTIPTDDGVDGALAKALLTGNFEAAVDICIGADKMAEAMVLAVAGGSDLLQRTRDTFFKKKETQMTRLISSIVNRDWTQLVRCSHLDNWREVLAAVVTYAGPEEFSPLCDLLGERLENEGEGRYQDNANLCYICSGNVDKFVECWNKTAEGSPVNALALQELVEKVVLLLRAVQRERKQFISPSSSLLADKFKAYSSLLASQGSLTTALSYLEMTGTGAHNSVLHDRLYQAQGGAGSGQKHVPPFQPVDVQPHPREPDHQAAPTAGNTYSQGQGDPSPPSNPPSSSSSSSSKLQPQPYILFVPLQKKQDSSAAATATTSHAPIDTGGAIYSQAPPSGNAAAIYNPIASTTQTGAAPSGRSQGISQAPVETTWNDPPLLKSKKSSLPAPIHQPIMSPIMAPVGDPVARQQALPTTTPTVGNQQHEQPAPSPGGPRPPLPPRVERPPIPPEHQPMVSAFETVLQKCRHASSTPATRRKTDDISKKLTILCDLLRESRISPEVLHGLHYISQDASSMNYQAGMARYTQMVSSGSFSEISSFMPAIKALLQLALQLRV